MTETEEYDPVAHHDDVRQLAHELTIALANRDEAAVDHLINELDPNRLVHLTGLTLVGFRILFSQLAHTYGVPERDLINSAFQDDDFLTITSQ